MTLSERNESNRAMSESESESKTDPLLVYNVLMGSYRCDYVPPKIVYCKVSEICIERRDVIEEHEQIYDRYSLFLHLLNRNF